MWPSLYKIFESPRVLFLHPNFYYDWFFFFCLYLFLTENFSVTILIFNKCRNYLLTPLVWALLEVRPCISGANHPYQPPRFSLLICLLQSLIRQAGYLIHLQSTHKDFSSLFPGPIHDLANRTEFVSCYDRSTRNPYWVIEHITKASLAKAELNGDRKDQSLKKMKRFL